MSYCSTLCYCNIQYNLCNSLLFFFTEKHSFMRLHNFLANHTQFYQFLYYKFLKRQQINGRPGICNKSFSLKNNFSSRCLIYIIKIFSLSYQRKIVFTKGFLTIQWIFGIFLTQGWKKTWFFFFRKKLFLGL